MSKKVKVLKGKHVLENTNAPAPAADGLDIPAALKRDANNVSPAMRKGEARLVVDNTKATATKPNFNKPMSMSDEEFAEAQARFAPVKANPLSSDVTSKEAKKVRVPRAEAPAGTFKLSDWAKSEKLDPRHVRRAARSIKGELSKLYVQGMKYVFADKDRAQVAKLIRDAQANESKKTIKAKPAKATKAKDEPTKMAPPSETVWSGKAKKAKPAPAPVETNAKAEARKVIAKAVKSHAKKRVVINK